MSRNEKLALFEKSVPMADAWKVFASPENSQSFAKAEGGLSAFSDFVENGQYEAGLSAVFKSFHILLSESKRRDEIIEEMREDILERLYNEDLMALAVRVRPSRGFYPVQISADFFDNAVADWLHSTLEGSGMLYEQVRIYDPYTVAAITPAKPRKGSVDLIESAIAELKLAYPDFGNLPRKLSCQMIREKLGNVEISGNGLSDKNLSKRIISICGRRGITK